jgi:hypothetical protein
MVNNLSRLDELKKEIILNMIVSQTKCCAINWVRMQQNLFEGTFDETDSIYWDFRLEKIISSGHTRYFFRVYRNDSFCLELTQIDELKNVYDVIDLITARSPCVTDAQNVFMDLKCCVVAEEEGFGGVVVGGLGVVA